MSTFQYPPINEDAKEIRLLTLFPGSFSSEVHAQIHTTSLTPVNPPKYEALSYAWGSVEYNSTIKIRNNRNEMLKVTRSLACALPYLRYKDKARVLWIDALCVNQQDLEERSRQVLRMSDIFKLAERVVVWLGPERDDSSYACRLIGQMGSKIKINWNLYTMEQVSENGSDAEWADRTRLLPYGDREMAPLYHLFNRSWFERLWIWQEITMANGRAIVMCGYDTVLWQSYRTAVFCLYTKTENGTKCEKALLDRLDLLFLLCRRSGPIHIENIMDEVQFSKCYDPRDRIYAILGILCYNEDIGIKPDYTKPTHEIYQEVALRSIDYYRSLNILSSCEMQETPSGMPSWVPDWAAGKSARPFEVPNASGNSRSEAAYVGNCVLRVTGVQSSALQHVENVLAGDNSTLTEILAEIRRLAPSDILGDASALDTYCRTLCTSRFAHSFFPPCSIYPHLQQSTDSLIKFFEHQNDNNVDLNLCDPDFLNAVSHFCEGRSIFQAMDGNIGLAPKMAQPGDLVAILLGCKVPILLRPDTNHRYRVVGECYMDGVTHGEALLGPLPTPFEAVHVCLEEEMDYCGGFVDRRTGITQFNDPRLGTLHAPGSMGKRSFMACKKREVALMTPEVLKARGIDLQVFDLV
ncbi:hypothetical protein MMC28_006493 [Mycoblastus sanguinarius]|nr:hypothetical protein [Mycoblastus sanguinarius]